MWKAGCDPEQQIPHSQHLDLLVQGPRRTGTGSSLAWRHKSWTGHVSLPLSCWEASLRPTKGQGECTHSIRSTEVTPICWNQSPHKSQHQGCPVQTLPPTSNHVPGRGACTPVWEHEGGRHHWLRERVGPAERAVDLGRQQGMQTDFSQGPTSSVPQPRPARLSRQTLRWVQ